MKKLILLCITCTIVHSIAQAQEFYTRFGLGYAFPQAGQTMDGTATPYNGSASNSTISGTNYTSYDLKKLSFSSGVHGVAAIGYMFNKHVGVETSLDYLLSAKDYTFTYHNINISNIASDVNILQRAKNCLLFTPALVLQSEGKRANLYTRLGIVLPLNTKITQDQVFTNLPGTGAIESDDFTWEIKNKFALGFSAAAGVRYQLNNRMKLWGEVSFLSLAVYAKEANLTDVSVNGQGGYLSQVPMDQRKVVYSSNFTSTTNDYYHQPVYSQPFSNVTVNVGVYYEMHSRGGSRQKGRNDVKYRRR